MIRKLPSHKSNGGNGSKRPKSSIRRIVRKAARQAANQALEREVQARENRRLGLIR